jgi:hypothetical protein
MDGEPMNTTTKNAPEAGQGFEGNDHENSRESTMTKNIMTVAAPADIQWHDLPQDIEVTYPCTMAGCSQYGQQHLLSWGDLVRHNAFTYIADSHCLLSVDYYEDHDGDIGPEEANVWVVNGLLTDDEQPLTVAKVTEWMANYTSAVCLAAELNGAAA